MYSVQVWWCYASNTYTGIGIWNTFYTPFLTAKAVKPSYYANLCKVSQSVKVNVYKNKMIFFSVRSGSVYNKIYKSYDYYIYTG